MAKINFCSLESVLDGVMRCLLIPRPPVPPIPTILVLLAKNRPGLSSSKITASIISRQAEAGISNSSPEQEKKDRIMVEEILNGITQDAKMQIAIEPGQQVLCSGGNGGGPLVAVGSTISPGSGTGLIQ